MNKYKLTPVITMTREDAQIEAINDLIADQIMDGTDQTTFFALGFKNMFQHIGQRGLAIGSGNAGYHHRRRWFSIKAAPQKPQGMAGIGDFDVAYSGLIVGQVILMDYRHGALADGLADVLMAVSNIAGNGDKQAAGNHFAGIVADLFYITFGLIVSDVNYFKFAY